MAYCNRCGLADPEPEHECNQSPGRFCSRCGARQTRRDGLCHECLDRHLDSVMPIADDLMTD